MFQFRRTKVEADDYGKGKHDTGIICQRIGNQAGYGILEWEDEAICQHILYNLCI